MFKGRVAAAILLTAVIADRAQSAAPPRQPADQLHAAVPEYGLRLSMSASVSGRKFLLFSFKGMLFAEANLIFSAQRSGKSDMVFTLQELPDPNCLLVTTGRSATAVYSKGIGETVDAAKMSATAWIAKWTEAYPDWAAPVKPEKRSALPFLLDPQSDVLTFEYNEGVIQREVCAMRTVYPWPSRKPIDFTLLSGACSSLALFNHSPTGGRANGEAVRFSLAPLLRDLAMTVLPEARSEVEFTDPGPLMVEYRCYSSADGDLRICRGETLPRVRVERSFTLDSYKREVISRLADGLLVSDKIEISLSGQKGNAISVVIELRQTNHSDLDP